jgi:pimeloyl-ACP methyl ester carboxylesterase
MAQANVNGVAIEYDVHGDGAPLLLIMGLGSQMIRWPMPLVDKLVTRGFRVIRFDNRDAGLSQKFSGAPKLADVIAALRAGQDPGIPYRLDDMAADAVGVLDHLGVARAHVAGVSMGGMIGQLVAADWPDRVLSFTSIMSTTGNPALPPATPEAMAVISTPAPDPRVDEAAFVEHAVRNARVIGSPGYPFDDAFLRDRALTEVRRAHEPLGVARQMAAITANGDRRPKLAKITAPVVVLHGDADPLVPLEGGRDTAASIPGAELRVIPGMGHDVPPGLYDIVVDAIAHAARRGGADL